MKDDRPDPVVARTSDHPIVDPSLEALHQALRRMPVPELRPAFVEHAFARATAASDPVPLEPASRLSGLRHAFLRWETWFGVTLGAAAATAIAMFLLRPLAEPASVPPVLALALHETRQIEVLIDSDRDLPHAIIRVAVTGGVNLEGFGEEREIDWETHLKRGTNLLSLPVVARTTGAAWLVATIEHEGRTRRVAIALTVNAPEVSRS